MSEFEFDAAKFFAHMDKKKLVTMAAEETAMHDVVDDLARISANIAPIDTGALRKSVKTDVRRTPKTQTLVGEVTFGVTEVSPGYGRFNYALWTHEADYNLGPRSQQAPGVDGYEVGNKYLERPLAGESRKYLEWLVGAIGKAVDDK